MATYKNGSPVNHQVTEVLKTHHSVSVLWWRHDLAKMSSFIREVKPGNQRQQPLADDDFVVLSSTGEVVTHGHGRWVSYRAVGRVELAKAHPKCAFCRGTGIATLAHFESRSDHVCSCTGGRFYWVSHFGTLWEVRLDRYEVVVVTADRGRGEEQAELLGKFISVAEAKAEAEKRRREPRFQPGSRWYSGRGPVVAVRVVERPLPNWAT